MSEDVTVCDAIRRAGRQQLPWCLIAYSSKLESITISIFCSSRYSSDRNCIYGNHIYSIPTNNHNLALAFPRDYPIYSASCPATPTQATSPTAPRRMFKPPLQRGARPSERARASQEVCSTNLICLHKSRLRSLTTTIVVPKEKVQEIASKGGQASSGSFEKGSKCYLTRSILIESASAKPNTRFR